MRRLLVLFLASLMLLATAACGNDNGSAKADDVDMGQKIDGLSVSGSFGAEPKVKVSSAVTADKPESVEICFVPDDDYVGVLERHLPAGAPALAPGPLVTTSGEVIGKHEGYARYTIGQRRGLPGGFAEPRFVVAIHPERREVVIGTADELTGHRVTLEEVNWLADPLETGASCEVQIRYRAASVAATVLSTEGETITLGLEAPVRAISPGQSGVLYGSDGQVLGGGVIA